ncbi:MAG TPA: L-histidine N(alpha)-methyltransferase [Candidatus Angelobacter sp.]|nr:L-histidine N(alpha)-methyltransferase [Candidatus Angelobacter sp.]
MTASRLPAALASPIAEEVLAGLSAGRKHLPPKLFYDARGSELFEQITQLPEYYLTRTERGILQQSAAGIVDHAGSNLTLVEMGAGSASKTRLLIDAILRRQLRLSFHPVDVSPAALRDAVSGLNGDYPNLLVSPLVADYSRQMPNLKQLSGRKLVLFIGSTIGNFSPREAVEFLARLRKSLGRNDALLLGFDMRKDKDTLHAAYNDAQGVTDAFNKNLLARINRELGGQFNLDSFRHVAFWNPRFSRIEMHLESRTAQTVLVRDLGQSFDFAQDERIHTENSYKFSKAAISRMLRESGLRLVRTWTDSRGWFSEVLARV